MEMLILFVCVVVPLMAIGFYAMYRENKEKRKEHMDAKNA
jgi:preprotein translocase subunit YajC